MAAWRRARDFANFRRFPRGLLQTLSKLLHTGRKENYAEHEAWSKTEATRKATGGPPWKLSLKLREALSSGLGNCIQPPTSLGCTTEQCEGLSESSS